MNQLVYNAAVEQALRDLPGTVQLAKAASLRAIGATEKDLEYTSAHGIPAPVLVLFGLALGAILGVRYLPDDWQYKIRHFGE